MQDLVLSPHAQLWLMGLIIGLAGLSAGMLLWALAPRRHPVARQLLHEAEGELALLFSGSTLVDATAKGHSLLAQRPLGSSVLEGVMALLAPRFPTLGQTVEDANGTGTVVLKSAEPGDASRLTLDHWSGMMRLVINDPTPAPAPFLSDLVEQELSTLRLMADNAPSLVWVTGPEGDIQWANEAYLALSRTGDAVAPWPPRPLFPQLRDRTIPADGVENRLALRPEGAEAPDWYSVTSRAHAKGAIHFASNANQIVAAETNRKTFVQTLTKTFAHLSIGLVIFDKHRALALFNPALLQLLGLPVDFLAQRPSLTAFLDKLREERMIPEPKNYKQWRKQILHVEAAAQDGSYCETWVLPGGVTYRVTGRPHPDGAIAFLFEDISAEVSLTRRFRAEIELGRAVIDTLDQAVCVFNATGAIILANDAFKNRWNIDPETSFVELTVTDCTKLWQEGFRPSPLFGEIRDFVATQTDRSPWQGSLTTHSGQVIGCDISPLPGGMTMIRFEDLHQQALMADAS